MAGQLSLDTSAPSFARDMWEFLFQSLVLSTMLHGAGAWGEVKETTLAPINRAYIAMCRSMLARHFAGDVLHAGEDRILAHLGLPQFGCQGNVGYGPLREKMAGKCQELP